MIRVASIGTSMITGRFARAVAEADGIELACVYSRDPARAATVATELGVPSSSSDLDALLARRDIDAVYVASPNTVHAEQCRLALAAGKHVLVEKPATTSAAETADLVARARAAGLVWLEAIRSLYDPGFALVRELLPRVGAVRRVSFRFHQRSARYDTVLAGGMMNVFDPAMGGGALFDLGVYCVQALVDLFGEPREVQAAFVPIAGGADGAGVALAGYPGFVADVSFSKITATEVPSSIEGELGTLVIDHLDDPRTLSLLGIDQTRQEFAVVKRGSDRLANMLDGVERFVGAVSGHLDLTADQDRSVSAARTLDAVRAAADSTPAR